MLTYTFEVPRKLRMAVGGGARRVTVVIQEREADIYGCTSVKMARENVIILNPSAHWVWSQWERPVAAIRRIAETVIHEMVHVRQFKVMLANDIENWDSAYDALFSKQVAERDQAGEIEAFAIGEASIKRPSIWALIEPIARDLAKVLVK